MKGFSTVEGLYITLKLINNSYKAYKCYYLILFEGVWTIQWGDGGKGETTLDEAPTFAWGSLAERCGNLRQWS